MVHLAAADGDHLPKGQGQHHAALVDPQKNEATIIEQGGDVALRQLGDIDPSAARPLRQTGRCARTAASPAETTITLAGRPGGLALARNFKDIRAGVVLPDG